MLPETLESDPGATTDPVQQSAQHAGPARFYNRGRAKEWTNRLADGLGRGVNDWRPASGKNDLTSAA